uniref:ABC transporter permease n=1 Tax=Paraburkholderia tropica TaxID=92647 RepID=UPI002AB5E8FA
FPVFILLILSVNGQSYLHFPPTSFSMRWFSEFFGDRLWLSALLTSLEVGLIASMVSTVLGFFAAYFLVRSDMKEKKLLLSFMLLPIIVPNIITAIAMYFISGPLHLVGNIFWIGICHSVIALPIVLLMLLSALQGVDANLERAALSLGCSRLGVFFRVVIPLTLPGIVSAALFAFLTSFDELIISLFLAGVGAETLPVRIWNSLHMQIQPVIAAVSAFLIAVTGLVLVLDAVTRQIRESRA